MEHWLPVQQGMFAATVMAANSGACSSNTARRQQLAAK
jgi:hypothetical protein